jgi:hypothetical protein
MIAVFLGRREPLLDLTQLVKAILLRRPQRSQRVSLQHSELLGEVACARQLRMRHHLCSKHLRKQSKEALQQFGARLEQPAGLERGAAEHARVLVERSPQSAPARGYAS